MSGGAMARVVVQNVWQQKHPTPTHSSWEFHFHPRGLPPAIAERIAAMDVGLASAPQTAWSIDGDRLIWLRSFVAIVPSEQRRYTGIAGVVAAPAPGDEAAWGGVLPSLLGGLELPPAQPWAEGAGSDARTIRIEPAPMAIVNDATWTQFPPGLETARTLAHALVLGGAVGAQAPLDDRLPALWGALSSWLPPGARALPRAGSFVEGTASPRARTHPPAARNLLHYLARAWVPHPDLAQGAGAPELPRTVWRMVHDVSRGGVNLVDLFDELTLIADVWDAGEDLRRYLARRAFTEEEIAACDRVAPSPLFDREGDARQLWNRVLNYWGRGFLRRPSDEAGLLGRLATILAYRILVDHLFHLDSPVDADRPRRYLRRLEYEAALARERVTAVLSALGNTMPTLFETRRGAT
jgi:hypothetical protein